MIQIVYRTVLIITLESFLTACMPVLSHIGYQNGYIVLQRADTFVRIEGIPVAQKRENFTSLFLTQTLLKLHEGNLVVFEKANTDLQYEFEPTLMRIINVVFETRRKILVYRKDHIHAYQLILPSGRLLNLIAQQSESQELQLLYGMTTPQLNRILRSIDDESPSAKYQNVITFHQPSHAIFTHWDIQKVHFYPLVVPLPRFLGL